MVYRGEKDELSPLLGCLLNLPCWVQMPKRRGCVKCWAGVGLCSQNRPSSCLSRAWEQGFDMRISTMHIRAYRLPGFEEPLACLGRAASRPGLACPAMSTVLTDLCCLAPAVYPGMRLLSLDSH